MLNFGVPNANPRTKSDVKSGLRAAYSFHHIGVGRGGPGGPGPPNNLRGGANIPFGPPNNPPTFPFNFYVKQGKNHKCTKLKRKIIINVTLI